MKRDKLFSALWAFLLSFALSLSATMCAVTAFGFGIDTGVLVRACAIAALAGSVCYSLPLSLAPAGIGAVMLGYLWQKDLLEATVEAFLNRLTRQYDKAYGWGVIRWSYRTADEMEPDIVIALCILGVAIALLCAWSVCRRKTGFPALTLSFLTFATCFVVNDTVPDAAWLYLFLLSVLVLMMTGSVRQQDEQQGNRLTLLLTPIAALALLVLFAAIPRDSYNRQDDAKRFADSILYSDSMQLLLGRMDENNTITASDTGGVDLKTVGYRIESQAQVLQVTAPYTGTVYLRGRALDAYDGLHWQQSNVRYNNLYWPQHQLQLAGDMTITTRFAHRMLYLPYYAEFSEPRDISTGLVNVESLTEYTFSCRKPADPAGMQNMLLSSSAYPQTPALKNYIPLDETVLAWAQPLAEKLTAGNQSIYQQAQNIASYVRNSASYSTQTPRMPATEKNFARWFLEQSDTGYCIHFATATTVLLQAAGIPARYVTGYMAQVTEGQQVTVYADQAHAWAEYWLPGYGWTVLESTPAEILPETTAQTTAAATTLPITPTGEPPSVTVPADAPGQPQQPQELWALWVLLCLVSACALFALAELQRALRLRLRRQQLDAADPNQKALLYWQAVTVRAALLKETPDAALYALAEKAKFSQYTLTEADLQVFEAYLQAAKEKLHRHNLFKRFYYRFLLAVY